MKILITGGNGMVGRNVLEHARKFQYDVDAPSRQTLDLSNEAMTKSYFANAQPDVVIHTAGLVGGIQANIKAPFDFCFNNLQIGMNVIRAAFDAGVKKLINLGSSCMYPRLADNPLKESDILSGELEPTNEGYAVAKIAVARLCDYLSQQKGVFYKTLIPCNLYGLWDKFGVENSHMIPAVIRKIHEANVGCAPFVDIWGDGTARREFLFAADLADFIFFVLPKFEQLNAYTNVGVGLDHSINEYYDVVRQVLGYRGDFKHDLTKPAGMKQKLVDVSAQRRLGWEPKTDLVTGIEKTYQFFLTKEQ